MHYLTLTIVLTAFINLVLASPAIPRDGGPCTCKADVGGAFCGSEWPNVYGNCDANIAWWCYGPNEVSMILENCGEKGMRCFTARDEQGLGKAYCGH